MMPRRATLCMMAAFLAAAFTGGCATRGAETTAFIAPNLSFRTPAPRELGASVQVAQLITARYGTETHAFEAQLAVSPERLTLVCLDPFGRRALTVTSTGARVTVDAAPWLPDALRAENILADIAIVYWPEDAVRRGFSETKAVVAADARHRTVMLEDREVIRVDYDPPEGQAWPRSVRYRNHAFGYELILRSAVVSP